MVIDMKKKKIVILCLTLVVVFIVLGYTIYFFTTFKPGKFGDLELKQDGTFVLDGCGFEKGFYEVENKNIYLYLTDNPNEKPIFVLKILNVNKLKITGNGTNCPQYTDAVYKRD